MESKTTELLPIIMDGLKWLGGAAATVVGWIGGRWALQRKRDGRRKALKKHLDGLPPECKAALLKFHERGVHTMRGDPGAPPIQFLISDGIIREGPSGGSYAAVDCYLTIRPDVWDVMDDWVDDLSEQLTMNGEPK